jgi:hypothetical protein
MAYLEIKTGIYSGIVLNEADSDNEVEVSISGAFADNSVWINKDQAIQIINHLKQQLDL